MDRMVNEKSANNQITPEEAYECRETSMLLHELIDELPEEQRQCILLYYMEEYSIKDIAGVCKCSENTIKSRLNYGKKKLEEKTIELQKKGYVLRGVTPVYLITWLLKTDMGYKLKFVYDGAATSAFSHTLFTKLVNAGIVTAVNSGLTNAVGAGMNNTVQSGTTNMVNSGMTTAAGETISGGTATVTGGTTTGSAVAGTAAKGVASTAVKGGIHTLAGKIITGALVTVITGGLITAGVVTIVNNNKTEDEVTTEATTEEITTEVTTENPQDTQAASEETTTEDDGYTQMTDDDYADLICGGLSKRETEIMFECLWVYDTDNDIVTSELSEINYFEKIILNYADELSLNVYDELYNTNATGETHLYETVYYTDKINNMLEAVQMPLLNSENYNYYLEGLQWEIDDFDLVYENTAEGVVIGDFFFEFCPMDCHAEIESAKYNDDELRIVFKLYRLVYDHMDASCTQCKYVNYEEAIFLKNDSGKYYLSTVQEYNNTTGNETANTEISDTWKNEYIEILGNDNNWGITSYSFSMDDIVSPKYLSNIIDTEYSLISIENDDIPYLAIKRTYAYEGDTDDYINLWYIYKYDSNNDISCYCQIYDYIWDSNGITLTVYNNELAWYVNNNVYDLCYASVGSILLSSSADTEAELTAAKDQITYYNISDTSAIDNY